LYHCAITATNQKVSVQAGEFDGCVQVRSSVEGAPGATNDYYAPNVGHVLTTFSTAGGERRNTELLSFSVADYPDEIQ
jgi:hypothetical protein